MTLVMVGLGNVSWAIGVDDIIAQRVVAAVYAVLTLQLCTVSVELMCAWLLLFEF